jgi:hypothetical protein
VAGSWIDEPGPNTAKGTLAMTHVAARVPDELVAQVAVLLDRAALLAWQHAEAVGTAPLHDLGLCVYLARGTAAHLLNTDHKIDEPEDINERSILELLTDAESLIGPRTDFMSSGLAVELCDLIRQARALGR